MDEYQERQQARELLEAEVSRDFPDVVNQIKYVGKVVLVRYRALCFTPTPECIRRIGALAVVCSLHGATVIFAGDSVLEVRAE
jgi:hypothetical protein